MCYFIDRNGLMDSIDGKYSFKLSFLEFINHYEK